MTTTDLPNLGETFSDALNPAFDAPKIWCPDIKIGESIANALNPVFDAPKIWCPDIKIGESIANALNPVFDAPKIWCPDIKIGKTIANALNPVFDAPEIWCPDIKIGETIANALNPAFDAPEIWCPDIKIGESIANALNPGFLPGDDGAFVDVSKPLFNNDGTNAYLLASPRPRHSEVELCAEFRLSFGTASSLGTKQSTDSEGEFNPQQWELFSRLEQRLRREVRGKLEDLAGRNWLRQRVPPDIRERWKSRQAEDRAAGRLVHDAIEYADFMDLVAVIKRRDNWQEAFELVFRNSADIEMSFRRLNPVRKALAHSRFLSSADLLTLLSEAAHIFRALGTHILR